MHLCAWKTRVQTPLWLYQVTDVLIKPCADLSDTARSLQEGLYPGRDSTILRTFCVLGEAAQRPCLIGHVSQFNSEVLSATCNP